MCSYECFLLVVYLPNIYYRVCHVVMVVASCECRHIRDLFPIRATFSFSGKAIDVKVDWTTFANCSKTFLFARFIDINKRSFFVPLTFPGICNEEGEKQQS